MPGMFERPARSFLILAVVLVFAATGRSQSIEKYAYAIRNGDTEQKREAIFQLRNLRSVEASLAAAPALSDPNPIIRASAAAAVIFLDEKDAAKYLTPLLSDRNEFVRREAAYALSENGAAAAVNELVQMSRNDTAIEAKNAAVAALGSTREPAVIATLAEILRETAADENEFTRRSAARSIGRIALSLSGRTDASALTPQNFLPSKFKRTPGEIPDEYAATFDAAAKTLTTVLNSRTEPNDIRREAAFALGAIGNSAAKSALVNAAEDTEDPYLAEIAREGLLNINYGRGPSGQK